MGSDVLKQRVLYTEALYIEGARECRFPCRLTRVQEKKVVSEVECFVEDLRGSCRRNVLKRSTGGEGYWESSA